MLCQLSVSFDLNQYISITNLLRLWIRLHINKNGSKKIQIVFCQVQSEESEFLELVMIFHFHKTTNTESNILQAKSVSVALSGIFSHVLYLHIISLFTSFIPQRESCAYSVFVGLERINCCNLFTE